MQRKRCPRLIRDYTWLVINNGCTHARDTGEPIIKPSAGPDDIPYFAHIPYSHTCIYITNMAEPVEIHTSVFYRKMHRI